MSATMDTAQSASVGFCDECKGFYNRSDGHLDCSADNPIAPAPKYETVVAVVEELGGTGVERNAFALGAAWAVGYLSADICRTEGFDVKAVMARIKERL